MARKSCFIREATAAAFSSYASMDGERQNRTGDMNENEETIQENETPAPERRETGVSIGSMNAGSRSRGRPPLTPPPPSAPGEFLKAQNHPLRHEAAGQAGPAPVTPPPPSVPTEFLGIQEWKDSAAKGPDGLMRDFLKSTPRPPREFETGIWPVDWPEEKEAETVPEPAPVEVGEPVRVRGLPLARGEEITRVLLPDEGLSDAIPSAGQALILTNRRLIAFRGLEGFRDTHVARPSDIRQFSVRTGQRNWTAILQGILMMVSGGFLYLVVGYWLAGQISGPNVPVLNIDVAPLIALLIILAGLLVLLQNYFTRPAGALIFRGRGVEFSFPFRSALDVQQIYEFVDLVQRAAQRNGGQPDSETP